MTEQDLKIQEMKVKSNESKEDIDNLIDILIQFESDFVCDELCGWDMNDNEESWCERNCGNINDGSCPSKECYLEYLKMKGCYKKDKE